MARTPRRSVDPDRNVADVFDGRYRLDVLVGRGGMGSVYRGVDLRLDRAVAIKVLTGAPEADSARFHTEVRTLAQLLHPHLVRLLDAGESNGRLYLVMDLVDGPSLATRLSSGPLTDNETTRVALGVAGALGYIHERGIVHRDVKPGNILLDARGEAFLADFGIARLLDTSGLTATGFVLGTPAYLAPEQVLGEPVGPAADVYALGLVLAESLSGERAFSGTAAEMTGARLHRGPTLPESLRQSWRDLLGAMCERDPTDRIDSAAVVARLSDGVGDHIAAIAPMPTATTLPMAAEPQTLVNEPTPPDATAPARAARSRRGPMLAGLAAVLAAGLIVGLSLGGVFSATASGAGSHRHDGASHSSSTTVAPNTTVAPTTSVATTTSTTSTTTSTTTTTTSAPSVSAVASTFLTAVQNDVNSGDVTDLAARPLADQLMSLENATPSAQATQQFDQLASTFNDAVAYGQITGAAVGSLTSELNQLAASLDTSVPTTTFSTTPPGGPGFGHGFGH